MKHTALSPIFAIANSFATAATLFIIVVIALSGCGNKKPAEPDVEATGQQWVSRARMYMAQGQWTAARAMIDSLRTHTPTALNAREDGIIVLDSIELMAARQVADSLQDNPLLRSTDIFLQDSASTMLDRAQTKVKFYEKKIAYDLQHKQRH